MTAAALPRSVAVVGLGMIGGSLCRALRRHLAGVRIIGVDPDPSVVARALGDGVCDSAGGGPELLQGAEVVVLSPPLDTIPQWLEVCARLPEPPLVTDCGSTKGWIVEHARGLPGLRFLGGHPMAGREQGGYARSDGALFDGCTWVLTPEREPQLQEFAVWRHALAAIGARLEIMSAADHDRAAAWASHLPMALSSALVRAAAAAPEWPGASRLAAGGFRDTTRLAGGDPRLHGCIAHTNADALSRALGELTHQLEALRGSLGDAERAQAFFEAAHAARREWSHGRSEEGRPAP